MRLQIFSDVHLDIADVYAPALQPGVDVVVVAGDLCEGIAGGARWLRRHLGEDIEIVLVPGNHEYFARVRSEELAAGRMACRELGVRLLDNEAVVIGGVRFAGATLWADYEIYGAERRDEMMAFASRRMMDHRRIFEAPGRFITPEEELGLHRQSRTFLERTLAQPHCGPTVVVTHHGPHPLSLAERHRENLVSAAFISDLSALIECGRPALWVHGHTHVSFDYRVAATRIICNPHGYADENPAFEPAMVIEV